jgi:hypothetical protein
MAVSCALGKLMVHFSDFENTDVRELRPLKICLGKRAVDDINELCSMLHTVAGICPSLSDQTDSFMESLLCAREFLTDRFAELRRQQGTV